MPNSSITIEQADTGYQISADIIVEPMCNIFANEEISDNDHNAIINILEDKHMHNFLTKSFSSDQISISSKRSSFYEEPAFIAAVAYLGPLIEEEFEWNEEFSSIINYPVDDVHFLYNLSNHYKLYGDAWFTELSKKFHLNKAKFIAAWKLALKINRFILYQWEHSPFHCASDKKPSICTATLKQLSYIVFCCFQDQVIPYITNYGDRHFYDSKTGQLINLPLGSISNHNSKFLHGNTKAAHISIENETHRETTFIIFASKSFFNKISHLNLLTDQKMLVVGPAVAADLKKQNIQSCRLTLLGYDQNKSTLEVICPLTSSGELITLIKNTMNNLLNSMKQNDLHYFKPSERDDYLVVLGPGLMVHSISQEIEINSITVSFSDGHSYSDLELESFAKILMQFLKNYAVGSLYALSNNTIIFSFKTPEILQKAFESIPSELQTDSNRVSLLKEIHPLKAAPIFKLSLNGQRISSLPYNNNCSSDDVCSLCDCCPDGSTFTRLMHCGHLVCNPCLANWIKTARIFPIKCKIGGCEGYLFYDDIRALMQRIPHPEAFYKEVLGSAVHSSLEYYIRRNHDGMRRCMTPNCQKIFKVMIPSKENECCPLPITCNGCGTLICTFCGHEFHANENCQQNYKRKYLHDSAKMDEWIQITSGDHRYCPNISCKAVIEKTDGCHHMHCQSCGVHFCWICDDFQAPNEKIVYHHMNVMHSHLDGIDEHAYTFEDDEDMERLPNGGMVNQIMPFSEQDEFYSQRHILWQEDVQDAYTEAIQGTVEGRNWLRGDLYY